MLPLLHIRGCFKYKLIATIIYLVTHILWNILLVDSEFKICKFRLWINCFEFQEPADMSGKFGLGNYSSRKHISISVPSSTEVMSPHIKSVEELRVLGINLSSFNTPTQFFICVAGVFLFYLIYGYLQVTFCPIAPFVIVDFIFASAVMPNSCFPSWHC